MWDDLEQNERRRDLVKSTIIDSSRSARTKQVKEEEDVAFTSKGQQEQHRRKEISKVKCFICGELRHYDTQCPLRKKDKEEKQDQQATSTKIDNLSSRLEEEFSMVIEIPPGERWDDLAL